MTVEEFVRCQDAAHDAYVASLDPKQSPADRRFWFTLYEGLRDRLNYRVNHDPVERPERDALYETESTRKLRAIDEGLVVHTGPDPDLDFFQDILFKKPIHRSRWAAYREAFEAALEHRTAEHGRSRKDELFHITAAAYLWAMRERMGQIKTLAEWKRELRAAINKDATEDLLGPGWWRPRSAPLDEASPPEKRQVIEDYEILAGAFWKEFVAGLPKRERELVELWLQDYSWVDAAARMQPPITPGTAGSMVSRIKKKVRKKL